MSLLKYLSHLTTSPWIQRLSVIMHQDTFHHSEACFWPQTGGGACFACGTGAFSFFLYLTTAIFLLFDINKENKVSKVLQSHPHTVQIEQTRNDLCTLDCALYLITWRWITVLDRDTFFWKIHLCRSLVLFQHAIAMFYLVISAVPSTAYVALNECWSRFPC